MIFKVAAAAGRGGATVAKVTYYVRRQTYRGREGWHVGSRGRGWNISIFVESRAAAERIRDAYKSDPNYEPTIEDMTA